MLLRFLRPTLAFITLFIYSTSFTQINCNKEAKYDSDKKRIPESVCIQKNLILTYEETRYKTIDFNQDGLNDYVITTRKKNQQIGDSTFISFYKKKEDSTYQLIKTLGNIIPIYFDSNNEYPLLNDSLHKAIFECYQLPDPLYSLEFSDNSIEITQTFDGHNYEMRIYHFVFNTSINNWELKTVKNTKFNESSYVQNTLPILITDFTFCNFTFKIN
jgi:hypothetical protein